MLKYTYRIDNEIFLSYASNLQEIKDFCAESAAFNEKIEILGTKNLDIQTAIYELYHECNGDEAWILKPVIYDYFNGYNASLDKNDTELDTFCSKLWELTLDTYDE